MLSFFLFQAQARPLSEAIVRAVRGKFWSNCTFYDTSMKTGKPTQFDAILETMHCDLINSLVTNVHLFVPATLGVNL